MSSVTIRASASFQSRGSRAVQEDFALTDAAKGIFAVADGFGGAGPGATASKTACEAVRQFLFKEAGDRDATLPFVLRSYFSLAGNVLFNALIFANRKVSGLNKGKGVHEKGGASVIAGFIDGDLLALANVGACSAVLIRGGKTRELVLPRTYARLADPFGGPFGDPFRTEPVVDAPLMALGMSEDLEPEICEYRVREGDWLILHSDGVDPSVFVRLEMVQQKQLSPAESLEEVRQLFESQKPSDNASISLGIF